MWCGSGGGGKCAGMTGIIAGVRHNTGAHRHRQLLQHLRRRREARGQKLLVLLHFLAAVVRSDCAANRRASTYGEVHNMHWQTVACRYSTCHIGASVAPSALVTVLSPRTTAPHRSPQLMRCARGSGCSLPLFPNTVRARLPKRGHCGVTCGRFPTMLPAN